MIKEILVHADDDNRRDARFALAAEMAKQDEAHLIGLFALEYSELPGYVSAQISAELLDRARETYVRQAGKAREAFEAAAGRAGVRAEWRQETGLASRLLAQHGLSPGEAGLFEALAAASFMLGSLSIWLFNLDERPSLLFFGGLWLTAGGLMLVFAGFPLTGGAVMLASLETARGGLSLMRTGGGHGSGRVLAELARILMAPYCRVVTAIVGRFPAVGGFIQERPFLTSSIIKMPLRFEFILRNLLVGDAIGVAIGFSWMLGDGALALNDERLNRWLAQRPMRRRDGSSPVVRRQTAVAPGPLSYGRS